MERIWVIGWKREYMIISGGTWDTNLIAHESHGLTRRQCATGMATGSVALIYTNAMRGIYDDNRNNLRQLEVVLGAIGNELIFAH